MDMGYALLQNNIMNFEFDSGEYNLDISSNTLGMIEFYEPNLSPSQQTNALKTSFDWQYYQHVPIHTRTQHFLHKVASIKDTNDVLFTTLET